MANTEAVELAKQGIAAYQAGERTAATDRRPQMGRWFVVLLLVLALSLLTACLGATTAPTGQTVTMEGYDPATGQTIDPINVFDRLPGGRRVGTVRNGTQVTLIRREADSALITTPDGVQGYVAAAFIKEFQ